MWLWELQGAFRQFAFCMRRRRHSPPAQTETRAHCLTGRPCCKLSPLQKQASGKPCPTVVARVGWELSEQGCGDREEARMMDVSEEQKETGAGIQKEKKTK